MYQFIGDRTRRIIATSSAAVLRWLYTLKIDCDVIKLVLNVVRNRFVRFDAELR